jgi:SAM-dependent methyltransferase
MKLDYGSGSQPKAGFLSSDFTGTPNYDYHIRDYRVIGARDASFDEIHCRNVIHHIPERDLPILFSEFRRILKSGGILTISEPRKGLHRQNLILDIIWYRFLVNERNIMIPREYVDYRKYMADFDVVETSREYNNDILVCVHMKGSQIAI